MTAPWSAVVTGGASGLGQAVADELLSRGAYVVVADLESAIARRTQDAANVTFINADVRNEDDLARAVDAATMSGPLRALVACAGIGTPGRVLRDGPPHPIDSFERVIGVNLVGTFNAVRLAAQAMRTNDLESGNRGVIVMTSSVAAFDGQVGQVAYAASKGGVAAMTLPLARDLAEYAIRVLSIAPGMFDTPLLAGLPSPAIQSLARQVPHPSRLGDPREFAALVGHLLDNHMLNGETIRIDGALRMAPR